MFPSGCWNPLSMIRVEFHLENTEDGTLPVKLWPMSTHIGFFLSLSLSFFFFFAFVIIHGSETNQTVHPSTHLLINKPIHPPIHLLNTYPPSTHLCIHLAIQPSIHPSVYPSTHPLVHPFIYSFIHSSSYPPTRSSILVLKST